MSFRERAHLRTRLRQVNMEYSALVRERSREGRLVRMTALTIMSLLFSGEHRVAVAHRQMSPVAILHAAKWSWCAWST